MSALYLYRSLIYLMKDFLSTILGIQGFLKMLLSLYSAKAGVAYVMVGY